MISSAGILIILHRALFQAFPGIQSRISYGLKGPLGAYDGVGNTRLHTTKIANIKAY